MKIIIENGLIVNEETTREAAVVVVDDRIESIIDNQQASLQVCDKRVDAKGCFVIPGIIDTHVHFRDPGLTHKGDIESESAEAARGGITTYFDMPNTLPQTTSLAELIKKQQRAAEVSAVNYAFFIGATNDNIDQLTAVDPSLIAGIKLFMGSSTGNMLVERRETLEQIFAEARVPIVAHCEDTALINYNLEAAKRECGGEPPVEYHPVIRSDEACYKSTALAIELARKTGATLHVAHLSTARELTLFSSADKNITAEAVIAHLWFSDDDYSRLGTRIKCNPAIKTSLDRDRLRKALLTGAITTVATDHAPHLLSEKQGGCVSAASGMPMVRFSLSAMMQLVDKGVLPVERLVTLMAHNPARLFGIRERGFIRPGYKADLTIVAKRPLTVSNESLTCRCGWSPMEGETFSWQPIHTFCNGQHVLNDGVLNADIRGERVEFQH